MSGYPPTPILTTHARERCAEMQISTKVPKQIVRHADMVRPGKPGDPAMMATSDRYPDYAVVFSPGEPEVIVTVLFREHADYVRDGATCLTEPGASGKQ